MLELMSLAKLKKISARNPSWIPILQNVIDGCTSAGQVDRIYVFGSFARNEMHGESDLDIAVIIPDTQDPKEFREKLKKPLCEWPSDLIVATTSRFNERREFGGVLFEVYHDGIEIYPTWNLQIDK